MKIGVVTRKQRLHRKCLNIVQPARRQVSAEIETKGTRLTLRMGKNSRYLEMDRPLPSFENFDFAVFILAALSMRRGTRIRFDLPVSQSAAFAVTRLHSILKIRAPFAVSPLDLELTNIIDDCRPGEGGGLLCISGGVDSTFSAAKAEGYSEGLAIRGFDFPLSNDSGFGGRKSRMQQVADHFGMPLRNLTTDLSLSFKTYFDVYNVFFYAACLSFAGYGMTKGGFSGDLPHRGQLSAIYFSTSAGIDAYLSTKQFPIEMLFDNHTRSEKLRAIHEVTPDLLKIVGFCLNEQESGGNCGICEKCMRTRIAMDYGGLDQTLVFDEVLDATSYYKNLKFTSAMEATWGLVQIDLAIDNLPDGPQRNALIEAADKHRRRWLGLRAPIVTNT